MLSENVIELCPSHAGSKLSGPVKQAEKTATVTRLWGGDSPRVQHLERKAQAMRQLEQVEIEDQVRTLRRKLGEE